MKIWKTPTIIIKVILWHREYFVALSKRSFVWTFV
jgi:hypothetical protein